MYLKLRVIIFKIHLFKSLLARLQAAEDEKKAFQEESNKFKMELEEKYEAQMKLENQVKISGKKA